MSRVRAVLLLAVLAITFLSAADAGASLIPMESGQTVYDTVNNITWLADGDLAKTMSFGLPNRNGAMDYQTALAWVGDLNTMINPDGSAGYLHHTHWQLPTTPLMDGTCTQAGFAYGCTMGAMGYLYNSPAALNLRYPNTAVAIPGQMTGPFENLQPYLYWSGTSSGGVGYHTFSFNTGWQGGNVDFHYMYVLPMIQGQVMQDANGPVTWLPAGVGTLLVSSDGTLVYDPVQQVTWAADADLALSNHFGAQCTKPSGERCINADGSMDQQTANNFVQGMRTQIYDGLDGWTLPSITTPDGDCSLFPNSSTGFGCTASPMDSLFQQLGLGSVNPFISVPDTAVGPFHDIQPYLYWSCQAGSIDAPCSNQDPIPGQAWSFSFGNGFQGTDYQENDLYVIPYYRGAPAPEPSTLLLLASGLAGMTSLKRRKRLRQKR